MSRTDRRYHLPYHRVRLLAVGLAITFLINSCGSGSTQIIPVEQTSPTSPPIATQVSTATQPPTSVSILPESSPSSLPPSPTVTPEPQKPYAEQFPDPSQYTWQQVATGLNKPIGIAHTNDQSGRLFIIEQAGLIKILKDGNLLPQPFLDISSQVSCCRERGLLGLAFHPNYVQNGYFFVNYTDRDGNTVISRFSCSDNPDLADPASEVTLLHVEQPYPNHNGGSVVFGPDGFLYFGLGDGGSGGDPHGNAQNNNSLLGKILRINIDSGDTYSIPTDNPFVSGGGAPEVWLYGLRNPWRFSFDRLTGDMFIGDVGQDAWEEIDYYPAGSLGGSNFGWNYREGLHPYRKDAPPAGTTMIDPFAEYDHSQGESVTGGYVYRGEALPAWQGIYLYGDFASGKIWGLIPSPTGVWQNELLFETQSAITSFGEDEQGEIYFTDYGGEVYRLSQTGS